jgi:hypothetical protein
MPRTARLLFATTLLLSGCATRPWLRAESPHLVVYSEVDDIATRDAIASVEGFGAFVRWATRCEGAPAGKLSVYLVDSASELQRTWPGSKNLSCYVAAPSETFAIAIHEKTSQEDQTSFFALLQAVAPHFTDCAPMWLTAALAEYYGETVVEGAGNPHASYSNGRVDVLHEQGWLELDVLLGKKSVDDADVPLFDAQSWLLLRYFRSDPARRAKLAGYVDAVRGGQDPIAAMPAAGFELGFLREELEAYFAQNVVFNPYYAATVKALADGDEEALRAHRAQKKEPAAPVEISRLPPAETEHILEDRAAKIGKTVPRCEPDRNEM